MKYFCSKCGKTTQYNFELPKFCSYCGQSFANTSASKQAEDKGNKFLNELKLKKNINATYEDENVSIVESNIDFKNVKPSFKINVYQNKGESFASLLENPSELIKTENNIQFPKKSKEEILAEFQKEAGLLRSE